MRAIFITILCILFFSMLPIRIAYAADGAVTKPTECADSIFTTIGKITAEGAEPITKVSAGVFTIECIAWGLITFLSRAALLVTAILIALAGLSYMTASGAPDAQTKALKKLNSAIIGFAIILSIAALINFFLQFIEYSDFITKLRS